MERIPLSSDVDDYPILKESGEGNEWNEWDENRATTYKNEYEEEGCCTWCNPISLEDDIFNSEIYPNVYGKTPCQKYTMISIIALIWIIMCVFYLGSIVVSFQTLNATCTQNSTIVPLPIYVGVSSFINFIFCICTLVSLCMYYHSKFIFVIMANVLIFASVIINSITLFIGIAEVGMTYSICIEEIQVVCILAIASISMQCLTILAISYQVLR